MRTYQVVGEDLSQEHVMVNIAFDGAGRLYALHWQLGILRFDTGSGRQETYASVVSNLPTCSAVPSGPCSPTIGDNPPFPNDIVFDDEGNLYITDSQQATIFRVPPGGGQPQIWFQDAWLDGFFGPNGIRLSPDRSRVFFVSTLGFDFTGTIFSVPLVAEPSPADLQTFFVYDAQAGPQGPDQLAFGRSGNLYVTLAIPGFSGISILAPNGTEVTRLGNTSDPFSPYDSPASIAFNAHGSLLVTNHAHLSQNPEHFQVLDVFVGDKASGLALSSVP